MRVQVEPFRLVVKGYSRQEEAWIGTLLTLSNGRIAVRGELELEPFETGTLRAGYYADIPLWRREIVLLPRINGVYVVSGGEPVQVKEVERVLNLREGVLEVRAELVRGSQRLTYTSASAVHKELRNLYMQRVRLEGCGEDLAVTLPIELSSNPFVAGARIRHYDLAGCSFEGSKVRVLIKHRGGEDSTEMVGLVRCAGCAAPIPVRSSSAVGFAVRGCSEVLELERYVVVGDNLSFEPDWDALLASHRGAWRRLWERLGLEVEGDGKLAGAISFYTYHLLQLVDEKAELLIIPSKGLHGLGYRGHVFWDTDLYLALFLSALYPEAMRKVLAFRCETIEAARAYAAAGGFAGARYPWESADDGFESTPRYVPIVEGSSCYCADILTGEKEIHITADVAFAVDLYYWFTGDVSFMADCGLRIMVETARFWASRVSWDSAKQAYVIRDVIGPDEYHVGVDNNYYTNFMAKLNLLRAAQLAEEALSSGNPYLRAAVSKLRVTPQEIEQWRHVAGRMFEGRREGLVVEQFEGFFDLEEGDPNLSCEPVRIPVEELKRLTRLKVIKQADVVLALLIRDLIEGVPKEVLEANYRYYLPRTTHESSLSLPIYAAVALSLKAENAESLLSKVLETDLGDLYGNTGDGFHVAAAGGLWYAILYGLLGMRLRPEGPRFEPSCISGLKKLSLNMSFRGVKVRVSLNCEGEPAVRQHILT